MGERRESWLILSHAFNMDGRAASHTITDKIPHLISQGIEPIVLSAATGRRDEVVEHHQLLPVSPAGLRFDVRYILRRRISSKPVYNMAVGLMTLLMLPFYVLEKMFVRLEPQWSWFIPAYFAGARVIRSRQPAVIYSTGGANSAHMAGYLLARRFGLPWIAEVHDPMIFGSYERSWMAYRFAAWLEGKICRYADVPFWFVETALARALQRHPEMGDRGRVLIPGADRPAFGKVAYQRGSEFVVGHFGSLSVTRNLDGFLQALARLLEQRPEVREVVRVEIYGSGADSVSAAAIARFPAPEMIRQIGRLERDPVTGESGRERVLKRMNTVDCLLLLHGTEVFCEEYIPSKFYEYLWTQRPILGLVWRNQHLERLLRDNDHIAVAADDVGSICDALSELFDRWNDGELGDSGRESPYTAEAATRQLVAWARDAEQRHAREEKR
jgi:glycosyltransferase involved in cell wall biosynthesis